MAMASAAAIQDGAAGQQPIMLGARHDKTWTTRTGILAARKTHPRGHGNGGPTTTQNQTRGWGARGQARPTNP
eukprot:11155515-Lingulodinium_polyedra.AAC.1